MCSNKYTVCVSKCIRIVLVTQCWLWALRIVENPYTRNSNRLIGFRVSFSTRQESIRFRTIRFKIYWIYSWTFKLTEAFFKEDKRNRSSYKFFFCLFFWSSIVKKEENKFCLSILYKQTKQKPTNNSNTWIIWAPGICCYFDVCQTKNNWNYQE